MHEVAAMQGMVQTVLEYMQQAGGARVTHVQLVLGASGHFTEEAARQHFAVLTMGTPAEGAALEMCWVPATFQCFSCLHRFESCAPAEQVTCPRCGDLALEISHLDTCSVKAIEVSYDENAIEAAEVQGTAFLSTSPSQRQEKDYNGL
jgi:hydrogenase nickel incorporation protein HypA/HybF